MYYKTFNKYAIYLTALLFLFIGMIFLWLPIPLGFLLMGVGIALIITHSSRATRLLKSQRARYRRLNRFLKKVENRVPDPIGKILSDSDPNAAA